MPLSKGNAFQAVKHPGNAQVGSGNHKNTANTALLSPLSTKTLQNMQETLGCHLVI